MLERQEVNEPVEGRTGRDNLPGCRKPGEREATTHDLGFYLRVGVWRQQPWGELLPSSGGHFIFKG